MEHIQIGHRNLGRSTSASIRVPLDKEKHALDLLKAFGDSRAIPVKIYELVFSCEGREYCISTTSKDVFLSLGSLGEAGQRAFALLIYHRATTDGRALVTFPYADGCKGYLCIATRQTGNDHKERVHIDVSIASDK